MRAENPLVTSITIPSNAGPGQPRIVIQGNTITGYYADDNVAWQAAVDPAGFVASYTDDSPLLRKSSALFDGAMVLSGVGDPTVTHGNVFLTTNTSGTLFITLTDAGSNQQTMLMESTGNGAAAFITNFETWNHPTAATNWAIGDTGGSFGGFQFRRDAEDNLKCIGAIHMTLAAGLAAGTYSFLSSSIAVPYHPAQSWRIGTAEHTSSANVFKTQAMVTLNANGVFQITTSTAIAQNDNFYIFGEFPLGNIS